MHPNKTPMKYTYWDYKTKARERNVGWHIDYFLVTEYFIKNKKIKHMDVLDDFMGSDHAPICLILDMKF